MNTGKFNTLLKPGKIKDKLHIIGCGAVGSTLAVNLARCGLGSNLVLWDFDRVEPHNMANQQYRHHDIGQAKVDALAEIIKEIDPLAKPTVYNMAWNDDILDGYVFLAVDSIDTRREIVKKHMYMYGADVKAMFDFRMRFKDAQHFAALWTQPEEKKQFLDSMSFTSAEVEHEVNACNMTQSIIPTVHALCAVGVANFINIVVGQPYKLVELINPFI